MYQKYFNCRPKEFKSQAKITFENNPQFKSIKDESLYHDKILFICCAGRFKEMPLFVVCLENFL